MTPAQRRRDPTTGEWRRFAGSDDALGAPLSARTAAGSACFLCPTTTGGPPTGIGAPTFDVVVLQDRCGAGSDADPHERRVSGVYQTGPADGVRELIVYSDDHHLRPAAMCPAQLARVAEVWADRYADLGRREDVSYVLVVDRAGTDAVHPHGEVHASTGVPPQARLELDTAAAHLAAYGTCVWCDVVAAERADGIRIVARNEAFLAFVPFATRVPYEVHVVAHRHAASLLDLSDGERAALANLYRVVLRAYEGLFGVLAPHTMVMHQSPTDDGAWQAASHLHLEITPDGCGPSGDAEWVSDAVLTPEVAAAALREAAPAG